MGTAAAVIYILFSACIIFNMWMNLNNSSRIDENAKKCKEEYMIHRLYIEKINIIEDNQRKLRTDINELYTKPIVKQTTSKKPVAKKTKRKSNKNTKQILKG